VVPRSNHFKFRSSYFYENILILYFGHPTLVELATAVLIYALTVQLKNPNPEVFPFAEEIAHLHDLLSKSSVIALLLAPTCYIFALSNLNTNSFSKISSLDKSLGQPYAAKTATSSFL
jgi:hypothetical protein